MKNLFKYGLVVLVLIASMGMMRAEVHADVDSIAKITNAAEIPATKIEGEMEVVMTQKGVDLSLCVAIAAIIANILMTIVTIWMQVRMQKRETKELYTRRMQEISINKQGELYDKLVSLENYVSRYDDWPTNDKLGLISGAYDRLLTEATDFLNINSAYIRGEKATVANNLLDKYKNPPKKPKTVKAQKERMKLINRFAELMQKP